MARTELSDKDRAEVAEFIERHWQSRLSMSRGKKFYPHMERGFIERREGMIVGLLTYHIDQEGMEILTLNSTSEGGGIGSSLMLDAIEKARKEGCRKIFLVTTNDRLRVIGFYQRLGFRMTAINLGAVDEARKVKPQIPPLGERGVPIHDEIVMSLEVEPYLDPESG
jgi:N-acetylglutamate synthase-like GNAT family acetyltransferase